MPTAQYPIQADLLQAFRTAIQAVRDWHRYGGAEPLVGYQGLPYHVSAIADHVAIFGDKMPYELYREVCRTAGSTVDPPVRPNLQSRRCVPVSFMHEAQRSPIV